VIKFLCFLLFSGAASASVQTIDTLEKIPIEQFSPKTLVMFDLDDVLLYPQDALLQNWRMGWKPEGVREWTAEEDTIAWMSAKFQLMDPLGPELIDVLNERQVPTMGFTSFAMDQRGIVESIPEWRSSHLKELGLNFRWGKEAVFSAPEGFIPPSFEHGVLYCGDFYKKDKDNKGKILSIYLDWLDWEPELIVFIDDGKNHMESVQKEAERRGIPFLGFLYIPKELDAIDEKVAEMQYKTIIDKKIWLSDLEAICSIL
jgi:hypothetical protein